MASVVDTVAAQLEQVRPILQEIFETSDQISSLFKKNSKNVQNLSRYLYRIPLQQFRGGTFKKYSANEGSLGKGTGMLLTSLQAGYFYSIMMFRVTDEQVDLSQNTKQSVVDVMAKTLADGMMEAGINDDIALHNDGTGELTNPSDTLPAANQLTFNTAGDTLGVSRLREGMACDIWSSTGATKRTGFSVGAPLIINTIDYSSNTVTFNQNVSDMIATDLIAFYDLDVYGPATLTSFSAGWPATGALTTAGGLTNDSFRHGLYYAHDFNNSNYYLGKQKSALPQIQPTKIDGNGQALQWSHGFAMLDKIRKRRSPDVAKGMTWIFPLAQRQVVFEEGVSIATKLLQGDSFGKSIDLTPTNQNYSDTFNYVDNIAYVSKRQYNDRIDAVNLKNWARAEVFPLRPYEKQGKTVFEGRASSGLLAAYSEFGFHAAYDFVCYDPGAEGAVINLQVPANY